MSISISIFPRPISPRPISDDRATPARSAFIAILPARLGQKLLSIRQRRARRLMLQAVEELGHPGVLADFHRATRS